MTLFYAGIISFLIMVCCTNQGPSVTKKRIIVSTDIGGTDPDDFQSMIHLLMYSDLFRIEGLISSPFGEGRAKNIMDMIDLYEKDFAKLKVQSEDFPEPDSLRMVVKQGAISQAPYKGYDCPTEGSEWIIKCAGVQTQDPLWILIWGGIEDLAQALHDAPEITEKIRVYWIGGPNKKWSVNAYSYIAKNHPDLWIIEANSTYRGWFFDEGSPESLTNAGYFENYIKDRGSMGKAFENYYGGHIKMGDSPSLAYLMRGDPDNPLGESWGGSFAGTEHSSRYILNQDTMTDTVVAYAVMEYCFEGPLLDIPEDSVCFDIEISDQKWLGYYVSDGIYSVRYSSKKPETASYIVHSSINTLAGRTGKYVSIVPWPGRYKQDDYILGKNWYTDRPEPELFIDMQQGAITVSRHRKEFLDDWKKRWEWLK